MPSASERHLMRSHLLIRLDTPEALACALASGADCLWLDLEQTGTKVLDVVPKLFADARRRPSAPRLYVGIRGLAEEAADEQLDRVMRTAPDGIVLSQAKDGADVQHLGAKLAVREAGYGLVDGNTRIIAMAAQMPAALFQMGTFAGASQRLVGLAWAPDALASSIGAAVVDQQSGALIAPLELARNLTLMAAKAAGVAAIDCATTDRGDARFRAECASALRDGFTGKIAVDPAQVAIINTLFGSRA